MISSLPINMTLTPNGKTLIVLYPGDCQDTLAEACVKTLGEPEMAMFSEDFPGNLLMLFPHQNLPSEIMEIAERLSTWNLLRSIGFKTENPV